MASVDSAPDPGLFTFAADLFAACVFRGRPEVIRVFQRKRAPADRLQGDGREAFRFLGLKCQQNAFLRREDEEDSAFEFRLAPGFAAFRKNEFAADGVAEVEGRIFFREEFEDGEAVDGIRHIQQKDHFEASPVDELKIRSAQRFSVFGELPVAADFGVFEFRNHRFCGRRR